MTGRALRASALIFGFLYLVGGGDAAGSDIPGCSLTTPPILGPALITVCPSHPTSADSIRVVGSSFDTDGSWTVVDAACVGLHVDTLTAILDVNWCNGRGDCQHGDLIVRYDKLCVFPPLPPGSYVAQYIERHLNIYDPQATYAVYQPFTVEASTPTLRRTWGSLKSVYR